MRQKNYKFVVSKNVHAIGKTIAVVGVAAMMLLIGLLANPALAAKGDGNPTVLPRGDMTNISPVPEAEFVPGEILVGLIPGFNEKTSHGVRPMGAELLQSFPTIGVERWKLPAGMSVEDAIRTIPAQPGVRFVEPNYIRYADAIPDDALRNELWGMHNLGQTGGTIDADIDALEAWSVRTDASLVVVGVIDSGIDYTHEDLVGNIWTNPGEVVDGVDNDGNGYVDDIRGWDCRNDDNDPFDDNGHGTHVAGTIGARGNNGVGVAGVNWQVKLMPLKFLSKYGSGTTADAIECINYAAWFKDAQGQNIVRITSNSYGGGPNSKAEKAAIAASGALFVAAAGNAGSSSKMFPAGYGLSNQIAVAATDHTDTLWSGSNYGRWVHLAAPGVDVLSAVPLEHEPTGYASFTGTSMACPHVSGAAALVLAENPGFTIDELKSQILNTVDVLPQLSRLVSTSGRLNVATAVGALPLPPDTMPPDQITDLAVDTLATTETSVTLTWTAVGDDGAVGTAYLYDVRYATSPISEETWDATERASSEPIPGTSGSPEMFEVVPLSPGITYYFAMKVADEVGGFSELSNMVSETTLGIPSMWTSEVVDSLNDVGTWVAMDVDSAGNPHISYRDETKLKVKYATWTGGAWAIQTIPDNAKVGRWTSIAVDTLKNPHIAYFDDSAKDLKYAHWTGTGWSIEVVDSGSVKGYGKPSAGNWNSIVLDEFGNPHISYRDGYDNTPGSLKYAQWTGSTWDIQVVDDGDRAALGGTSIDLDSAGRANIAYHDTACRCLRFAQWTGSAWIIETIEDPAGSDAGSWFMPRGLALNSADVASVSYCGPEGLKYAQRTPTWVTEVVDTTGCGDSSLVFDTADMPHIGYLYDTLDDVRYAQWTGIEWSIETVDGADSSVGFWAAIELGVEGKPMIAYTDYDAWDLKFAQKS